MKSLPLLFVVALLSSLNVTLASHVNILVYHHVAEDTPASTSVSPSQFRSHMQLLKDEGFTVVALPDAVEALTKGSALPEKAVAITFDDGFANIHDNAWPILKEFDYPFTLFVSSDPIDERRGDMLTWDQVRSMHAAGVTIANHSRDHGYLVRYPNRDQAWRQKIRSNIEHAQQRLTEELGVEPPKWLAYPYGEFSKELVSLMMDMGYVGFAQHSGGFWAGSPMQAIPRFAAAGIYANPKTLLVKLNSAPLKVRYPEIPGMVTAEKQPVANIYLADTEDTTQAFNCFVDGTWQDAVWLSRDHLQVTAPEPLSEGRHRYNCTTRSRSGDFYYWYSKPWLVYDGQH